MVYFVSVRSNLWSSKAKLSLWEKAQHRWINKELEECELCAPVSYPSSSLEMKASALATWATAFTSARVQSFSPYSILYLSEPQNSSGLWGTDATWGGRHTAKLLFWQDVLAKKEPVTLGQCCSRTRPRASQETSSPTQSSRNTLTCVCASGKANASLGSISYTDISHIN